MDNKYFEKYKKLGLNIAYYRRDKGYTQLQLAEMLDIDRTHIGKIESAKVGVSLDKLFLLSDLLEVPVYNFFQFRDSMGEEMKNLRKLREEAGFTQLAVQMKTGIDQSLLSKYENGERVPTVENLKILAKFYNTSTDYLLGMSEKR